MKELKTKAGHIVFEVDVIETFKLGSIGICDECNDLVYGNGYLVPVLNHFQCPDCYSEWVLNAKHYPEDDEIENKVAEYYRRKLK